MDNNYYVLTAKTCTSLENKFGVISESQLNMMNSSKENFIIEGPMDQFGALIMKDEKIKDLIVHHVRWSVMRNGYEPMGTFNGTFLDAENYCVVERGGRENWFTSKRGFLVNILQNEIVKLEAKRATNELDKVASVLYTDLCEKVYAEGDSLGKSEAFLDFLGDPSDMKIPMIEERNKTSQEEPNCKSNQEDHESVNEEPVLEDRMSSSIADRVKTTVLQDGDFIKFNVTLKKKPLDELTERIQKKVFDLVQADTDLQGLEFPTFKLTIAGIYVRVSFKIKGFNELHSIQYKCIKNNEYIYKLYPVEIVRMIKTTIMEAGKLPQEVKLDGHVDIPQEEKPKRDLHDYIIENLPEPDKKVELDSINDYDPSRPESAIESATESKSVSKHQSLGPVDFYKDRAKIFNVAFKNYRKILNDPAKIRVGSTYRLPISSVESYCGTFRYSAVNGSYAINTIYPLAEDAEVIMKYKHNFNNEIVELMCKHFADNRRVIAMRSQMVDALTQQEVSDMLDRVIDYIDRGMSLSLLVTDERSFNMVRIALIVLSDYAKYSERSSGYHGYLYPRSVFETLNGTKFDQRTIYILMMSLGYHQSVMMEFMPKDDIIKHRQGSKMRLSRDNFPTDKICKGKTIMAYVDGALETCPKYTQHKELIKEIFSKANERRSMSIYEIVLSDKDIKRDQIDGRVLVYVAEIAQKVIAAANKEA